jgi:N6-adenosine-specific RNA methylase IME4
MNELVRYEAACAALEAAVTADEVMAVHLTAKGIEAVARVAKNFDAEIKAVTLRTRAELRLGDMLIEGERAGIIAARGRQKKADKDSAPECLPPATLKEVGISNKLSARSKAVSGIGARAVAAMLQRFELASRKRGKLALDVIQSETSKRNADSRRRLAQEMSDCAALQPCGRKFPVVYADPAWRRKAGVGDRAYENHYETMTWDQIIAMPVAERALPDAWLFLWIPRAHLFALHPVKIDTPSGPVTVKMPLAYAVARGWGFEEYSTCFVWTKTDALNPDDHGLGLIAWDQDEILCMFKRGRGLPKPDTDKKPGSNYRAASEGHSAKPAYYREMINAMTGTLPVLELFAREDGEHVLPANFFTWGNQSNNTADLPQHDAETGEIAASSDDQLGIPQFLRRTAEAEAPT